MLDDFFQQVQNKKIRMKQWESRRYFIPQQLQNNYLVGIDDTNSADYFSMLRGFEDWEFFPRCACDVAFVILNRQVLDNKQLICKRCGCEISNKDC